MSLSKSQSPIIRFAIVIERYRVTQAMPINDLINASQSVDLTQADFKTIPVDVRIVDILHD